MKAISVHPPEGPCDAHNWPDKGLAARVVLEARRRVSTGGLNLCELCNARAKADAARLRLAETKPRSLMDVQQLRSVVTLHLGSPASSAFVRALLAALTMAEGSMYWVQRAGFCHHCPYRQPTLDGPPEVPHDALCPVVLFASALEEACDDHA